MKSVLISVKPKWCELIASGKKTVEIRKTKPKLETPFKVYIYCTNSKPILGRCLKDDSLKETPEDDFDNYNRDTLFKANGKVIGEFVCDEVYTDAFFNVTTSELLDKACLTLMDIGRYLKPRQVAHFWHISDLVIYDKPRELSELKKHNRTCYYEHLGLATPKCKECKDCQITRPPQSWCYVEERKVMIDERTFNYCRNFTEGI